MISIVILLNVVILKALLFSQVGSSTTPNCGSPSAYTPESKLTVDEIADQLLEAVTKNYNSNGKLSDDSLSLLHYIYRGPLLNALELVEKRSVTRVISPSGRELFQVIGASGTPYTCFPHLKYCSCPAFHFSVLCKEDHIMCKHALAMKLSEMLGLTKILHVSNAEITNMIMSVE